MAAAGIIRTHSPGGPVVSELSSFSSENRSSTSTVVATLQRESLPSAACGVRPLY